MPKLLSNCAFKISLILIFSLTSNAYTLAQPESEQSLWTKNLEEKVGWSKLSSAGTLLIGTSTRIQHLDTESGDTLWSVDTQKELAPFNIHDIEGSGYLVIAEQYQNIPPKTRLSSYELMTGQLIWETPDLLASNLAVIPDLERGQILYIGAFPGSPKDKTSGTLIRAYDLASGEMRFQTEYAKFNALKMHRTDTAGWLSSAMDLSGHAPPLIDGEVMYLPYRGLTAVNLTSGEIIWDYAFKTVDSGLKNTTGSPVIEGDIIYSTGRGNVVALNKLTGDLIWNQKVGSKYALPELQVLEEQIVVRIGGQFSDGQNIQPKKPFGVASLDKTSGKKRWLWKSAKNSITNMQILPDSSQVVVADKKNLYRLNLNASGKPEILEKRNLEFKRKMGATDTAVTAGKIGAGLLSGGLVGGLQGGLAASRGNDRSDPPNNISLLDKNLVIRGNYHVLSYSPETNTDNWSIEFSPPGVSGMMLAFSGAAMAFTSLGNAGYHTSMSTRNSKVDSSLSSATKLGTVMTRRYAAAEQAGNLGFFLTKADKESGNGLQLVGLNLTTGKEIGAVPIEEKEPVFTVDNIGRKVYYFHKQKEIRAFGF